MHSQECTSGFHKGILKSNKKESKNESRYVVRNMTRYFPRRGGWGYYYTCIPPHLRFCPYNPAAQLGEGGKGRFNKRGLIKSLDAKLLISLTTLKLCYRSKTERNIKDEKLPNNL